MGCVERSDSRSAALCEMEKYSVGSANLKITKPNTQTPVK
jgi:hypothetical protein